MGMVVSFGLTLVMLVLLQAVLGFDNLLYISIESKRVDKEQQSFVRRLGIGLAIILRIVLLFVVLKAVKHFEEPFFEYHAKDILDIELNVHALIVLAGGVFIIYTAMKEIMHMLTIHDLGHEADNEPKRSVGAAIAWIVVMNLVFSFDSILSAMAITENVWIMSSAIVISGIMMIFLADHVSEFLKRNRTYEVLGLFILFIVGIMLVSEGGEKAHLSFFSHPIHPMAKSTFYFVLVILVLVDIVQSRYQKKLATERARGAHHA